MIVEGPLLALPTYCFILPFYEPGIRRQLSDEEMEAQRLYNILNHTAVQ